MGRKIHIILICTESQGKSLERGIRAHGPPSLGSVRFSWDGEPGRIGNFFAPVNDLDDDMASWCRGYATAFFKFCRETN